MGEVHVKRDFRRHKSHWLLELLRGPTKADRDYQRMLGATLSLAQSDLSDEEARDRLRKIAMSSQFGADGVVAELEGRRASYVRESYLGDRAYRLAKAVMIGHPVEPQDPVLRDQFRAEEELGRLPLEVAFQRLVDLVPKLNAWRSAVEEGVLEIHVPEMKRLDQVVGPDSSQSNVLARSHLARAVATAYLSVLAGNTEQGDVHTPYFVIATRPSMTRVFGRRKPDRASPPSQLA
jgi:hypothetical protein